jgi:CHAT domain-containing protein/tetratricopeptide (TPR) repeat protein
MLLSRRSSSVLVFAVVTVALTAQAPNVAAPDAAAAAVRARLQEVTRALGERRADAARQLVLSAFEACRAAPLDRDDSLWFEVAQAADRAGDLSTAHEAFEGAARLRAERLPADHRDLQNARRYLAWAKLKLGDSETAATLLEDVHAILQRTVSDDDVDLQWTRLNLAGVKRALGDLPGALELQERVHSLWSRTLPADHEDLLKARLNLGITKRDLGQATDALALLESVHEVWSRTFPEEHANVLMVRQALSATKFDLRDLEGARDLSEKVYAVRSRTLPDDHPDLQFARQGLAVALYQLGDTQGAIELLEKSCAVLGRTRSEDDPELQRARINLASVKETLGDLEGARSLLERVFEVLCRTLPDDHHDVQAVRLNLGGIRLVLGDTAGAHELFATVHRVDSRRLPADHPDLHRTRLNLAITKERLGDLAGARELQERVHEVFTRTLPADHIDLQLVRQNLAATKAAMGDLEGAHALEEQVLAALGRTLHGDHPYVQAARSNLALHKRQLGDLAGANALEEQIYESRSRTLPADHPDLQRTRSNHAWVRAFLGDARGAARLAAERGGSARRVVASWALSPRELGALAAQESEVVDLLLTLAEGFGGIAGQRELFGDGLLVSQALRGVETRAARRWREARAADPQRAAVLERELAIAVAEVGRVSAETQDEGAGQGSDGDRLTRAVLRKERAQRALSEIAAGARANEAKIALGELAGALPERSLAAAIVGFLHSAADPARPGCTIDEPRLMALVLDRTGAVTACPLGPRTAIEELVTALRRQVGAGSDRGLAPLEGEDPLAVQKALRARVLDPILALAGEVETLWLAVDEALELVPLDALARADGAPVGTGVALRPLVSLLDLFEPPASDVGEQPTLLAVGGLDYDDGGDDALAVIGGALAPPADETRSGRPDSFRVLPSSATEVSAIASYFGKAFAAGRARTWTGADAGKAALVADVRRAAFVHLATHGYFAPETVASATAGPRGAITGLSPLVLCGLALSGANLPADEFGRHAGILTAEEILSLDLSRCFLVTLSACDTSLGVRRAGQGYASLRAALQGAGARFVLTSLWKVGDEATMELMVDFYRRLWVQKKAPHVALWEAKMAAQRKGAAFRDWAGWVLTGR